MSSRIGSLEVIEVKRGNSRGAVILLHGYGADYTDLAPLADELSDASGPDFYFPNGPGTIDIGAHMTGRAWFPLDVVALQRMLMTGDRSGFEVTDPPGLAMATKQILELVSAIGVDPENLTLGGFSQGAMVSLNTALSMPKPPRRLLLLSGGLVAVPRWQKEIAAKAKGMRILQSHGDQDPILPYAGAERLRAMLAEAGADVTFVPFHGGHGIAPTVLTKASRFIAD